jgi:predicted pyridoxine 5'-phosphate oxidase superfamily flavin-nucleotide-binding protein
MGRHYLATHLTPGVRAEQELAYGRAQVAPVSGEPDLLGPDEAGFIAARDSFYLASVTEGGAPYVQHRGGPPGFLHVIDAGTLAFADLGGNRQLLTVGHVKRDDRVALFLMDYPGRQRLKIDGRARFSPAGEDLAFAARLTPPGVPARAVERIVRIAVTAFDWNCPKYITPRFTAAEVAEVVAPLRARIAELEARLRGPAA